MNGLVDEGELLGEGQGGEGGEQGGVLVDRGEAERLGAEVAGRPELEVVRAGGSEVEAGGGKKAGEVAWLLG